jgi:hypothetical protein
VSTRGTQRPQYRGEPPSSTPPPFTPASLTDLAMWLDASDTSTITLDGSNNVEVWADKSGNGRNATQANATLRPSYATNAQNGLAGVLLDATDDRMTSYSNTVNPCTWFFVHRWNGATRDTRLVTNVGVNQVGLGTNPSLSPSNLSFVREGVAWTNSGFAIGNGTNRIYRVVFDNPTSTFWTWTGGTETQRQTLALVGTSGGITGFDLPGHHFERILYHRTLTAGEISQVYDYLSTKWGIT